MSRLLSAIILVAIIWLGSYFTNNDSEKEKRQPEPQTSNASSKKEVFFASADTNSQGIFVLPITDAIKPIRKWTTEEPQLTAQSIYVFETGSGKILLEKSPSEIRPIASLSKLITALVIMENKDLQEKTIVSQNAIETYGEMGNLKANEEITIENLLYALLIESSNDAAVALAESVQGGEEKFIELMNQKAEELGLGNTHFSDPSGLNENNASSAKDLSLLMREVIKYPLLVKIFQTPEIDIKSADGKYNHHLTNSNKLLAKYPEIIAGKTGYIDEAGECMVAILNSPNNQGLIVNVILNSQDRIQEMEKLILWEKEAFIW
ncbi:MAG: D-alanyl-D-alanine carboxypeptidase [Candidatus Portnoybacteria bacterium]|nr:D-alanyl-D-alanine carboxypeptidase [Candidatus Portnoybacteria bacterium]